MMEAPLVTAVTYDKNQAKIAITGIPDRPGVAYLIFGELGKKEINVDMIIQSTAKNKINDISFTVKKDDLDKALAVIKKIQKKLKAAEIIYDKNVAKVSIVGVGMISHPGVAAKMFGALAKENINIEMISTSEIKISCIIKREFVEKAVKSIHREFNLGRL